MSFVTTKDGVQIFYKDWGPKNAQPIVFHHGWPLSADDWDTQMLYFVGKGYRVIAVMPVSMVGLVTHRGLWRFNRWFVVIAFAAAAVSACTLFDEDPPDDSCESDTDFLPKLVMM